MQPSNYILNFKSRYDCFGAPHAGLSLAMEYASVGVNSRVEHFPVSITETLTTCCKSKGGEFASSLSIKSKSFHRYRGMQSVFMDKSFGLEVGSEQSNKVKDIIKTKLCEILAHGSSWYPEETMSSRYSSAQARRSTSLKLDKPQKSEMFDLETFQGYMHLGTACIVSGDEVDGELLSLLVNASRSIFVKEVMKVCIFCWKWISTARPDLEEELFSKIAAAWTYTIEREFGLFSRFFQALTPCLLQWVLQRMLQRTPLKMKIL